MIDALIKLYCDQSLPEPALVRLMELAVRVDEGDPMTPALGTNLVAYFTLQKGDFPRARRFGERAIRHFREADALFGEMHLYAHIGQAELATGGLAAAEANYRTMRDLCRERLGEGSDLEAIASVLAAEVRYLADDRIESRRLLGPALARIEEADGWFDVFAAGYLTATRLELNDHGPAAAYAAIDRGRATAERRAMGRLAALLEEELIRVATVSGDLDRALAGCRHAGLSLDTGDAGRAAPSVSSVRGDSHALIAARLLIRLDRPQDALAFLEIAEQQAQKTGTPLSRRITTRVLRALAESRLGRRDQALSLLSIATGLARVQRNSRGHFSTRARSFTSSPGRSSTSRNPSLHSAKGSGGSSARAAQPRQQPRTAPTISAFRPANVRFSTCSPRDSPTRRSPAASGSIRTRSNTT